MKKPKLLWKVIRIWEVEAETAAEALELSKKGKHKRATIQIIERRTNEN